MRYLVLLVFFIAFFFVYTSYMLSVLKPDEFYNLTLAQIFTPIMQFITLAGIAYYINVTIFKKNKSNEVLAHLTDEIIGKLDELSEAVEEYFELTDGGHSATPNPKRVAGFPMRTINPDIDKKEEEVLRLFRAISNKERFQSKMYAEAELTYLYENRSNEQSIINLKKTITGSVFKQSGKRYSITQKVRIRKMLEALINDYTEEKVILYKVK